MPIYKSLFAQIYDHFGFSPGGYDYNSFGGLYEPVAFIWRSSVAHLGAEADRIVTKINAEGLVSNHSHLEIKEDDARAALAPPAEKERTDG